MSFYDKILDSPVTSPYFSGIDMKRLIDHQTKFFAALMGGPASYTNDHLERVHALTRHFGVRAAVLLNKADIHPGMARHIEAFCHDHALPMLGSLPHSPVFMAAQFAGLSVPEFAPHAEGTLFEGIWRALFALADSPPVA